MLSVFMRLLEQPLERLPMSENKWERGGKSYVLDTYEKLHEGKLGAHWIWIALDRIASGENEQDVMRDYGYEMRALIK